MYLYGVPIDVASKAHLIDTKTRIRKRKNSLGSLKDDHDVEHLLSIGKLEEIVKKEDKEAEEDEESDAA